MPKFTICFADSYPDQAGSGGLDNNFYAEFSYVGSRAGAVDEAKRISFEKYQGDFKWWIIPKTRLVIISGPSCVGKDPLKEAVKKYSGIKYSSIPVIKSKESRPNGPRPDEVDKWGNPDFFRAANEIMVLKSNPQYIVGDCRGLPQAINLQQVLDSNEELFFLEVYHAIGCQVRDNSYLKDDIGISAVFLSPVSRLEIRELKAEETNLETYIATLMMQKLTLRSRHQGVDVFNNKVIEDNIQRAMDAYSELRNAHNYTHVIVNHEGESHPNWHRTPEGIFEAKPEGEASQAVGVFTEILKTGNASFVEHWEPDTI